MNAACGSFALAHVGTVRGGTGEGEVTGSMGLCI